jgi:hypothetical protein
MMFRVVFWDILPCKMIVDRRFRGAYCLHHQGRRSTIILYGRISQKTTLNNIDTGFLDFPVFKQMLRWFQSSKLLLQPSRCKIITITPPPHKFLNCPHYHFFIRLCANQNSAVFVTSNVFTLVLSLSEGRVGVAWEPSKMISPPPHPEIKSLTSPQFSLCFYSSTILPHTHFKA